MRPVVLGTIALHEMAGGLEKNIVLLANYLVSRRINVTIITFDYEGSRSFYEIDNGVIWRQIGRTKPHDSIGFKERMALIGRIRRILFDLKNPVVVCFQHGILFRFMAAAINLPVRFVCSERTALSAYRYTRKKKWSLNFILLTLANKITVQFPSYVNDYPFWMRKKIRIVPNPVLLSKYIARPNRPDVQGRFRIITVGRLEYPKDQIKLIYAFLELYVYFPEWDLYILGEGSDEKNLRGIIESRALSDRVFFAGKTNNVNACLADSHLFCLPSKFEGFPNTLAEAMACGLPAVGFASCAGVRDLVDNEKTGLLADANNLAGALERLMRSPELRKNMGEAAREYISRYSPERSFQKWDELMGEM
jgi:glycosyltransferase involved in cell wall biosynthesis